MDKRFAMMVLAHNEEDEIVACLDSIFADPLASSLDVYVMANGCTDRTEALVSEYARARPSVHLISIRLGDKCNAWNLFIHDTVPNRCGGRDVYFFMDGDARVETPALTLLTEALRENPDAHAASAVPGSGRSMKKDAAEILEKRGLVANLYALRGAFVERLRKGNVKLPLRLEGDDGLLGALIKWNLEPRGDWNDQLICPCAEARFLFSPMRVSRLRDWPKYWRRLVRYARRHYEFQLLGPVLRERGLAGMPVDVQDLYPLAKTLRMPWRGIYSLFFAIALREMRKIGERRVIDLRVGKAKR